LAEVTITPLFNHECGRLVVAALKITDGYRCARRDAVRHDLNCKQKVGLPHARRDVFEI